MPTRQVRDQHARTAPDVPERGSNDTRGLWDMAGPAQRGSRARGRSPHRASSARSVAAVSTAGPGSAATTLEPSASSTAEPGGTNHLVTRSTYRTLVTRGLAPDEAATLTAFMCGIPIGDARWSIRQVNQLLFLKALVQTGRFGSSDGGTSRLH